MEITQIVPGCCHLETEDKAALFASPPEIFKFILRAKKKVPQTGILPDISYINGVSQIALEFLGYWFLFVEQGYAKKRRFRIIGTPEMCARVKETLRITLLGPSREEMKRWKLSKTRIEMLAAMMDHMALKRDDKILQVDELFEFLPFPEDGVAGVPLFAGSEALVWRLGDNRFKILADGKQEKIDLNFSGEQLPLLAKPSDELELPQILRAKFLGSYSGFDPSGPTTGMVMWVNYNVFLVDGPVGTSAYLQRLGIPKSDINGVILTHVHDDHCTLVDMILSEQTVNIISTREIYESMLIKLSNILGEPLDQVRNYVAFTEVIPGKTYRMYGAQWEFFYTVHSIPTIGFRVSVTGSDGKDMHLLHSSDTTNFEGLNHMKKAGAITAEHHSRMINLVRGDESLVMIDGGGPPIHGVPSDYDAAIKKNKNTDFLFYHVNPDKVEDKRYQVATPGWAKTYLAGKSLQQSLLMKLLTALQLFEISDHAWMNILLAQGSVVELPPGQDVVKQGQEGDAFYFVLSGSQQVLDPRQDPPAVLALLEAGDFFGEMSIIRGAKRNATVRTHSASVLFKLPGELFLEFMEANGLKEKFERIWLRRPIISEVKIFRDLHPHAKHEISLLAEQTTYSQKDYIVRQGGKTDDFYIITKGHVDVVKKDAKGREAMRIVLQRGDFFGENVAMGYTDKRNASIVASSSSVETLKIPGRELRRLAETIPVLQHQLHLVMRERGLTKIPVTPREKAEVS